MKDELTSLIEVTALLMQAAKTNEKLIPLAHQAKTMLLESDDILSILLEAYTELHSRPNLPNPFIERLTKKNTQPQTNAQQLAETLIPILQQAQK